MPALQYATMAYRRDVAGLPELRVVNQYVEANPAAGEAPVMMPRPGKVLVHQDAAPAVRGVFQADGVLGGALVTVSDGLRLDGALVGAAGAIAGSDRVRFAAGEGEMLAAGGGKLYRFTASAVAPVAFPDDAAVSDVGFLRGRFLAVRADTGQFYWSELLDGNDFPALNFATAEKQADPLRGLAVVGDEVWLFGSSTVEVWVPGLAADLPFVPVDGRVFQKGCLSRDTIAALDNTVFWVSDERIVYRGAQPPQRISTNGIEERLRGVPAAAITAWAATWGGHDWYVLRVAGRGTWVFDVATGLWAEWESYGYPEFIGWVGWTVGDQVYVGSSIDGRLWRFDDNAIEDDGEPVERLLTLLMPVQSGGVPVDSLHMAMATGRAAITVAPFVEARLSRDGGFTWGPWRQARLGMTGQYRVRPYWLRWGLADMPGYVWEVRLTDRAPWRVSGAFVNEWQGGRSR